MTVPKNHHLLPEFYLRGFCNQILHEAEDHKSNASRCRVWIYDRTQDQWRERGVKNVAVEKHFYSADTPEGGRDADGSYGLIFSFGCIRPQEGSSYASAKMSSATCSRVGCASGCWASR